MTDEEIRREKVYETLNAGGAVAKDEETRRVYLEAMILLVMCWSPNAEPTRQADGQLTWTRP